MVGSRYLDPTLNGQNWEALQTELLQQDYPSQAALYRAIQAKIALLADPLTRFISPTEFRAMQSDTQPAGIGLQFAQDQATQEFVVVATTPDGPAAATILPGDVLLGINGRELRGMAIEEVAQMMRGQAGTSVTLTVQRNQNQLELPLTRAVVAIQPVSYRKQESSNGAIGYIRLAQFSVSAPEAMRAAIADLEAQAVQGYVLDLRSNPGGLLAGSVEIARMWCNQGLILSTVSRQLNTAEQTVEQERANGTALTEKPLVVLVNQDSANASEILAGALQANQRALLVGTETQGGNTIQSVRRLDDGSVLAITVAKWYPPSGQDISGTGLTPDIRVSLSTDQQRQLYQQGSIGTSADPQYAKALASLIEQINQLER
jgi:carboxyl-terminal processing protease